MVGLPQFTNACEWLLLTLNKFYLFILFEYVDTEQVSQTVFWHYTRFSGSLSSLDITNGNRSHNKPLELILTI